MFRTRTPFFSTLSPPNHPPPPIQHPISLKTAISFPSLSKGQSNPRFPGRKTSLAKINIHSIALAFSNLTDNILSPKEFTDMIEDALCSPITEEVSRGREDDDEKVALLGEHKRKRGSSILRPDPKQGRRTKEGVTISTQQYTLPSPLSRSKSRTTMKTKTQIVTPRNLEYKLLVTSRITTSRPCLLVKKEVLWTRIALFECEERYLRDPFLAPGEDGGGESLGAFGCGRGVWVGGLGWGVRWAVDLDGEGERIEVGGGRKGRRGGREWEVLCGDEGEKGGLRYE